MEGQKIDMRAILNQATERYEMERLIQRIDELKRQEYALKVQIQGLEAQLERLQPAQTAR